MLGRRRKPYPVDLLTFARVIRTKLTPRSELGKQFKKFHFSGFKFDKRPSGSGSKSVESFFGSRPPCQLIYQAM